MTGAVAVLVRHLLLLIEPCVEYFVEVANWVVVYQAKAQSCSVHKRFKMWTRTSAAFSAQLDQCVTVKFLSAQLCHVPPQSLIFRNLAASKLDTGHDHQWPLSHCAFMHSTGPSVDSSTNLLKICKGASHVGHVLISPQSGRPDLDCISNSDERADYYHR